MNSFFTWTKLYKTRRVRVSPFTRVRTFKQIFIVDLDFMTRKFFEWTFLDFYMFLYTKYAKLPFYQVVMTWWYSSAFPNSTSWIPWYWLFLWSMIDRDNSLVIGRQQVLGWAAHPPMKPCHLDNRARKLGLSLMNVQDILGAKKSALQWWHANFLSTKSI